MLPLFFRSEGSKFLPPANTQSAAPQSSTASSARFSLLCSSLDHQSGVFSISNLCDSTRVLSPCFLVLSRLFGSPSKRRSSALAYLLLTEATATPHANRFIFQKIHLIAIV
ncbi:hypothetical protein L596_007557 [Steinernema carpocapsae]|uniref:Uncharacterized protein n=1 Tax=Steinernema carpocapsae TaxID=34508 RepID=A0A4U5PAP8_STECR|nr:hypothetical protein L596_007557 [Steinernema carpocapsae]